MLSIKNIKAKIEDKVVLNGLNLEVGAGEVHAIMGPNGAGKSSLSKVIAGYPGYEVFEGELNYEVNFSQKNLLEMPPEERAREGVFLAMQYPVEVPGVSNFTFLYTAFNEVCKHQGVPEMDTARFRELLEKKAAEIHLPRDFFDRSLNTGFSGGEKKKNEILQMSVLQPRLAVLDETDSGLDIDALKIVAAGVNRFKNTDNAVILITHYQRLLDYIKPDFVHILSEGKIVKSGGPDLAKKLETSGYEAVCG